MSNNIRIFHIQKDHIQPFADLISLGQNEAHHSGFIWISCPRSAFATQIDSLQATLQHLCGAQLVDLHISDLHNLQLPSRYDYTRHYDLLVFRRLTSSNKPEAPLPHHPSTPRTSARGGPPILRRIDTTPIGFVVFNRVLLTIHPDDCSVHSSYIERLQNDHTHAPASPADLMLRLVNHIVDGYLALRRELTHQLDHWQAELIHPHTRFHNWSSLLEARIGLHSLDEIAEDQRAAIQDWIDTLKTWPHPDTPAAVHAYDLLQVRSRDVLEHIERVVHHVHRLEQSVESAVQIHFSAQSHRTNDIMRTLTALTAVFLPLNLIAGIFGMNFDFIPLLHVAYGFWWALASMAGIGVFLLLYFWRKRYLVRTGR